MFNANELLGQLVAGHFKKSDAMEDHRVKKYIVSPDAKVYEMTDMFFGRMTIPAKTVSIAEEVKTGFEWKLDKFPFEFLRTTVAFFRDVVNEFEGDEAILQYWYHKEEKKYEMVCLKQETSRTLVRYEPDLEKAQDENWVWVFDIHSHNHMSAFFSPTDDANEQSTGLYGVVGRVMDKMPQFKFRFSVEGQFSELSMFDLFEEPKKEDVHFNGATFPSEWLEIVREGKERQRSFSPRMNPLRLSTTWHQQEEYPFDFEEEWGRFQFWKDEDSNDSLRHLSETIDVTDESEHDETSNDEMLNDVSKMETLAHDWTDSLSVLAAKYGPDALELYLRIADDLLEGVLSKSDECYHMDLSDVDLLEEWTNILVHYGEKLEEYSGMVDHMLSNQDLLTQFIEFIETCGKILNTHRDEDGSGYESVSNMLDTILRITRDGEYTIGMEYALEEWENENESEESQGREVVTLVLKRLSHEMVEPFSNFERQEVNIDHVWRNFSEDTTSRMQKVYKKKHAASREDNATLENALEWVPGLEKTLALRFEFLRFLRIHKDAIESGRGFQVVLQSYMNKVLAGGYMRELSEMPSTCSLAKFKSLFRETSLDIYDVLREKSARKQIAGIDRVIGACQECEHPHARKAALVALKGLVSLVEHDVYFYDFRIVDFEDSFDPPPTRGGSEKPQESSFSETDFQANLAKIMQRNRDSEMVSETQDCAVSPTDSSSDLQNLGAKADELLQRYEDWMKVHLVFLKTLSEPDVLKMYKTVNRLFLESSEIDSEHQFSFTGISLGQRMLQLDAALRLGADEFRHPLIHTFYAKTALLLEHCDNIPEDDKRQKHVAERIMYRMSEYVKKWSERENLWNLPAQAQSELPVRTDDLAQHMEGCPCSSCLDREAVGEVYHRHAIWRVYADIFANHHSEKVIDGLNTVMAKALTVTLKKIEKHNGVFRLGEFDLSGIVIRNFRSYQARENLEADDYFDDYFQGMFDAFESVLDVCTSIMWQRSHKSIVVKALLHDLIEYYTHRSKSGRSSQDVSTSLDGFNERLKLIMEKKRESV